MDRREFIEKGCCIAIGASVALALKSCGAVHYVTTTAVQNRLTVKKSAFEFVRKETVRYRNFVMLTSEATQHPICLFKVEENKYAASLMYCTHNGCETNVQGDLIVCPCHGSEFTNKGSVLTGPAEDNLQTFRTETDDENIYVHLA